MKKEIILPMTPHFFKHADSKKERSIFLFDQLSLITVHRCLPLIIINILFFLYRKDMVQFRKSDFLFETADQIIYIYICRLS